MISGSLHLITLGHHCWLSGIPRLHTPARSVDLDMGKDMLCHSGQSWLFSNHLSPVPHHPLVCCIGEEPCDCAWGEARCALGAESICICGFSL